MIQCPNSSSCLTSQATLLPLLVDSQRVSSEGKDLLRRMILMESTQGTLRGERHGKGKDGDPVVASDSAADGRSSTQPGRPPLTPFSITAGMYAPAAAANFRVGLLREGDLPLVQLKRIASPTVIISSARDRLLPSIEEGATYR